jgi:hypothetical protein
VVGDRHGFPPCPVRCPWCYISWQRREVVSCSRQSQQGQQLAPRRNSRAEGELMHPAQEPGQLACARDPRPAHRSFSASTCTRTNRTSRRTVTASFFAGRSGRPTAPTISGPRCCSNCRTGLRRMDSETTSLLPLQWGLTTLQTLLDFFHPRSRRLISLPDGTSLRWAERLPYRRLAVWRRVLMFWRRPNVSCGSWKAF